MAHPYKEYTAIILMEYHTPPIYCPLYCIYSRLRRSSSVVKSDGKASRLSLANQLVCVIQSDYEVANLETEFS